MADTYSTQVRSRVMARVKDRDTSPEILLRRTLFAMGKRGWRCHRRDLPGKPDLAFGPETLAVFVDGAFWHGHPSKYWPGRTSPYWDAKIAKNQVRDRLVNDELRALGWTVIRLWDFEIEKNPTAAASEILDHLVLANRTPGLP